MSVTVRELQDSFREMRELRTGVFDQLGHPDEARRIRNMPVPKYDAVYFCFVRKWLDRNS